MIFVPKNAATVAAAASKEESRYALQCVRVIECKDDFYRLEASDGKVLAILCGPSNETDVRTERHSEADIETAIAAPNGAAEYLVNAKDFVGPFKTLKAGGRLLLVGSDERVTCVGRGSVTTLLAHQQNMRFPDINHVLPRGMPMLRFRVNPHHLAIALKVAEGILDPTEYAVEVLWYGPEKPVGIMAKNSAGQTLDCLVMPLD